jgi:hypothetical protein
MNDIVTTLNDPEKAYPDNFDTPKRANALLFGLCQEAAEEIKKLRTWVGLTDEEILEHQDCVPNSYSLDLIEFAQAIEAKLKEKNNGV